MDTPRKNHNVWLWIALTMLGVGAAIIAAFALGSSEEDQGWQKVADSGVLRVGLDAAYPPFEYVDETGEIVGFDVDLARELGRRLDLEIELHNVTYDGLYDTLLIGNVDLLISALVVAPEFEGKADFTTPYFNAGEHLIARTGSDIEQMEDLAGYAIAVEYGSGGDVEIRQWERRLADLTVERLADPAAVGQAVSDGAVDAALLDGISAYLAAGENPDLHIVTPVTDSLYAIAVHPDNATLLEIVDETLQEMVADGTISSLYGRWFGTS